MGLLLLLLLCLGGALLRLRTDPHGLSPVRVTMETIKVLVACEESQAVCKAFRARGFEAYSCDVQECSGGHPEWHLRMDALEALRLHDWKLLIAHPPCTYLSVASAVRMYPIAGMPPNPERLAKAREAKRFFLSFLEADIPHVCVENPTPLSVIALPLETQVIQPWQYGDPHTKRTCLWTRGLPRLLSSVQDKPVTTPWVNGGGRRRGHRVGAHSDPKMRSKTFPGIAEAMARQWGDYLIKLYRDENTLD